MATFRVDDFKSKLVGGGARANLFRATINFPGYAGGDVELTSLVGQIDVPFRGRQLKIAGDRTFENWTATVIAESSMAVRNSFERWLNGINEHQAGTGLVNPVDYQADILVEQLGRNDEILKACNIRGAFPVNLGAIELAYETTDTLEEFTCEFAYQYWDAVNVTS